MKALKSDGMLKIISLVIAIALWIYVVQVQNPDREETFKNVPVVFTQKAELEGKNLIILNDKERTVDLTIKGSMKNIVNISSSDITVVANLSSIEEKGSHTVVTSVVLPYGNLEVVNKKPSTITVEVDDLVTEEFDISVKAVGTPAQSYVTGEMSSTPEKVKVTGAKTIIDGIHSVVAEVDVNNKNSDIATITNLKIFDSNNTEINNAHVTFDNEEIQVRCEMLKTKTVDLIPELSSNLLSEDFLYQPDKNTLQTINIKGPADVIDKLTSVKTMPISLSDIDESGNAEIDLNLPDGVSSLDGDTFVIRFNKNTMETEEAEE